MINAFDKPESAWARSLESPDGLFARYETCDQIIEDIVRKAFVKEILRRELDPHVPFARSPVELNIWDEYMMVAIGLRVARQKESHIIDIRGFLAAMPCGTKRFPKRKNDKPWYKAYHRKSLDSVVVEAVNLAAVGTRNLQYYGRENSTNQRAERTIFQVQTCYYSL